MESKDGPAEGVAVFVKGLPRGRAAIDPNSFLFLQGGYTCVSAPPTEGAGVAGIDVLLDPRHEGKIYVGGVPQVGFLFSLFLGGSTWQFGVGWW